jgi:ABC-2 type transport system permease protein
LLYFMPAIWSIIFSFNVYMKYAALSGSDLAIPSGLKRGLLRMAGSAIEVSDQVDGFFNISRFFAILVISWYGGGLLADDRRLGAHLLWFARPLSRIDYLLGRLLTVLFFGAMATLVPGLLICATAAFNSPEWEFVVQEPRVILGTVAFAAILVVSLGLLVLAISSLSARKAFALLGIFGILMISDALARVLHRVLQDDDWRMISLVTNFRRIGWWLLDRQPFFDWPVGRSFALLSGLAVLCSAVLWRRVRSWEVSS